MGNHPRMHLMRRQENIKSVAVVVWSCVRTVRLCFISRSARLLFENPLKVIQRQFLKVVCHKLGVD